MGARYIGRRARSRASVMIHEVVIINRHSFCRGCLAGKQNALRQRALDLSHPVTVSASINAKPDQFVLRRKLQKLSSHVFVSFRGETSNFKCNNCIRQISLIEILDRHMRRS